MKLKLTTGIELTLKYAENEKSEIGSCMFTCKMCRPWSNFHMEWMKWWC